MKEKIIASLYIPIDLILSSNDEIRELLSIPQLTIQDIKIINELKNSSVSAYFGNSITQSRQIIVDQNLCLRKVKLLSFYDYLLQELLKTARVYASYKISNFIIINENYIKIQNCDNFIYWLIRSLSIELRKICPKEFNLGLNLSIEDELSLNIGCHNNYNFVIINNNNYGNMLFYRNMIRNKTIKLISNYDKNINYNLLYDGIIIQDTDQNFIINNNMIVIMNYTLYDNVINFNDDKINYIVMNDYFNTSDFSLTLDENKLQQFFNNSEKLL